MIVLETKADVAELLDGTRPDGQVIVETLGSAGVLIDCSEGKRIIPASPIKAYGTTGAGDTLAGEIIAHFVAGHISIDEAVGHAMNAAHDLLASRRA
jgi:sugar/nucleoside kinase (ribokinase family)